jgi:hypothetical protein
MPREIILYVIWRRPQEVLCSTGDYEKELHYLPFLQALCARTALSCGERASQYWGYSTQMRWSSDPAEAAAQVCLIHYDSANGCIWNADTMAVAARSGQCHALKFLHENGCPWQSTTCSSAASKGYLYCLQYAHEHGCDWDADTCTEAAQNGHLLCLKYAWENGCPLNAGTLSWAVGHPPCYEYLCEKGLLVMDAKLCASAARTENVALLTRLHSQGCLWYTSTCEDAAQSGNLACLRYAHENGCPWNSRAGSACAREDRGDGKTARDEAPALRAPLAGEADQEVCKGEGEVLTSLCLFLCIHVNNQCQLRWCVKGVITNSTLPSMQLADTHLCATERPSHAGTLGTGSEKLRTTLHQTRAQRRSGGNSGYYSVPLRYMFGYPRGSRARERTVNTRH